MNAAGNEIIRQSAAPDGNIMREKLDSVNQRWKTLCSEVLDRHERYTCALLTVKILKIGTPEIITIIVLQLEQLDFTVQYCVQKMQTE